MDWEGVKGARGEEMDAFKKHNVYIKAPVKECRDRVGKGPILMGWLDTNKGDKSHPELRSRLVAQDFKGNSGLDLFAAMYLAAQGTKAIDTPMDDRGDQILGSQKANEGVDVRGADFHADVCWDVYIELPPEDYGEGMWGKSMYGTRDAAENWEAAYESFMESVGFHKGRSSPCVFIHKEKGIRVVIHGDDFIV